MRIAILTSSYPRFEGDGVAPFVKSIAENLARIGHNVEVIAPYDIAVRNQIANDVVVHRFKYIWPRSLHIMGHAKSLQSDVKLRPLSYLLLPLYMIFGFWELLRVTGNQKSQVIHINWVLPNGPIGLWVAFLRRIPFVLSLHGSDVFLASKNHLFGKVASLVFKRAFAVTACSDELRAAAIRLGANPSKTFLLAWGADPSIFHPSYHNNQIRDGDSEMIRVVSLGRMVYKKGFDKLIEAWASISKSCPGSRLIIGGDGPLRKDLEQQVKELSLADSVQFPGQILWSSVPEFLNAADIFVLPSIKDRYGNMDGLPTVLLEAMSSEMAVVASNIGGVPLVIVDEETGRLVPPNDVEALSIAVIDLIKNHEKRVRLSKQARNSVETKYNWLNVAKFLSNLFSGAC